MKPLTHSIFSAEQGRGFTLLETLVAITILMVSITGPLYSAGRSLSIARNASNQLIATHFAQENVEYVRMMRDYSYRNYYGTATDYWAQFKGGAIGTSAWGFGPCLNLSQSGTKYCTIDPYNTDEKSRLAQCTQTAESPGICSEKPKRTVTTDGVSVSTIFTTYVRGDQVSTNEVRIDSTAEWTYKGTKYKVLVRAHLTPWE